MINYFAIIYHPNPHGPYHVEIYESHAPNWCHRELHYLLSEVIALLVYYGIEATYTKPV